jgi:hypothetical protein
VKTLLSSRQAEVVGRTSHLTLCGWDSSGRPCSCWRRNYMRPQRRFWQHYARRVVIGNVELMIGVPTM